MYKITNKNDSARVCLSRTGVRNLILPGGSILLEKLPKNAADFQIESEEGSKSETALQARKRKIKEED